MPTIAFLNQKGGSGKTTISINVACCLSRQGFKVLLVDSDQQGSARDWNEQNDGDVLNVIGLDRKTLAKDIRAFQDTYDYVVIDGAPQIAEISGAGVKAADLVIIPVQPSPYDIWACGDLVEVIRCRQEVADGKPKAAFVISRAIKNTKLSNEVGAALQEYELPVLDAYTTQRVVYPTSAAVGKSVFDSNDEMAKKEIDQISSECISMIFSEEVVPQQ